MALKTLRFQFFFRRRRKLATKFKVEGITLSYGNSEVLNVTTLRYMIPKGTTTVYVNNSKEIKRKHCGFVMSEPQTKEYKFAFKKHRLIDNFDFLHYGHV